MDHIAPLIWSNNVNQNGSIFDPRGRKHRLLRLLALLVRISSSLRAGPRVWSALEELMALEHDKIVGTQFCDTLSRAS
jgi:hypothetical protein